MRIIIFGFLKKRLSFIHRSQSIKVGVSLPKVRILPVGVSLPKVRILPVGVSLPKVRVLN